MGKLKKTALAAGITVLLMGAAAGTTYALLNTRTVTVANLFAGAAVNIGVVEHFNDDNIIIYEDMGEQLTDNINDVYDRIRDDNTTRTKEIAVKNIDSDEYPTTDTYVRVRLVPMIVYDDSKENIKAGIAGNIAAVDMRGKVSYSYANELKSKALEWGQVCEERTMYIDAAIFIVSILVTLCKWSAAGKFCIKV